MCYDRPSHADATRADQPPARPAARLGPASRAVCAARRSVRRLALRPRRGARSSARHVLVARARRRRRRVHQPAAGRRALEGLAAHRAGQGGGAARHDRRRAGAATRRRRASRATTSTFRISSRSSASPRPLIRAVIKTESDFDPNVVSSAGAKGLMQLMPDTARLMGVTDVFDPRQNIMGGARYLQVLARRFCKTPAQSSEAEGGERTLVCSYDEKIKIIAGYHAGPNAVEKYGGMPPYETTRAYVSAVMRRYDRYRQAAPGADAHGRAVMGVSEPPSGSPRRRWAKTRATPRRSGVRRAPRQRRRAWSPRSATRGRGRGAARAVARARRPARAEPAGAGAVQARAASTRRARPIARSRTRAPNDPAVRRNLGLLALKAERIDEAIAELELAAHLAPDDKRVVELSRLRVHAPRRRGRGGGGLSARRARTRSPTSWKAARPAAARMAPAPRPGSGAATPTPPRRGAARREPPSR